MVRVWLLASLLGVPVFMHMAGGGWTEVFNAGLDSNGITATDPAATWPVTGVTAPTVAWWADDPTGSGGKTTDAFTVTGTPTEVDTPFCPDGSWDDLTSGCLKAMRFDGSNEYYTSDSNGVGDPASGDMSVCALVRSNADTGDWATIAQNRLSWHGDGWNMVISTAGAQDIFLTTIENGAGGNCGPQWDLVPVTYNGWYLACFVADMDGTCGGYANGVADSTAAAPGGTVDRSGNPMRVGADSTAAKDFVGDIAFVWWWNSLLDATDMLELHEYLSGINEDNGAPVSFSNTGPTCGWVDGAIECYGDDMPVLGTALPPGMTGAGVPADGFYMDKSLTNSALYSRDLSTGWTDIGTPAEAATSTDLFRDARSTYRFSDNDGAAVEGKSQAIDITALNTNNKVQVCIYAKDSSGTVLDLQVDESGVCGGSTIDFAAKTITTSWSHYEFEHTVADGTCTTATYKLAPTDWGVVANTGDAEMVVQIYLNQNFCPPTYIETTSAAVAAGDQELEYDISGTTIPDASGNLVGPQEFYVDWTPINTKETAEGTIIAISGGSPDDRAMIASNGGGTKKPGFYHIDNGAGGGYNIAAGSQLTYTPGTFISYQLDVDYTLDAFELFADTVSQGTDSTAETSPRNVDQIDVCANHSGDFQTLGWCRDTRVNVFK